MVISWLRASARSMASSSAPSFLAVAATGSDAQMPWLPLPAVLITGSMQPAIRASAAAAV